MSIKALCMFIHLFIFFAGAAFVSIAMAAKWTNAS